MKKKEVLQAIEHLPEDAEVNISITGTAIDDGKYTTFNNLSAALVLHAVQIDPTRELSAKTSQEGTSLVPLIQVCK